MSAAHLLDHLITDHGMKNDARLCRFLKRQPAYISKVRSGKLPVNGDFILRVYDTYGLSIERIRELVAL